MGGKMKDVLTLYHVVVELKEGIVVLWIPAASIREAFAEFQRLQKYFLW